MHTLTNWKARRAGGRITVTGLEANGAAGKIVGVDVIEPRQVPQGGASVMRVIATDKNGVEHNLAFA